MTECRRELQKALAELRRVQGTHCINGYFPGVLEAFLEWLVITVQTVVSSWVL